MLQAKKKNPRHHGKSRKNDSERKLLHEQEMRRKKEEILLTFIKDKVSRESRISTLNSIKLNWQWRCTLREAKQHELHAETIYLRNKFTHLIQTKNQIINALTLSLNACDDEHNTSSNTQMKQLGILTDIQNGHLNYMQSCYAKQKTQVVEMLEDEMKNDKKQHDLKVKYMYDLDTCLDKKLFILNISVVSEFQNRRDELLNKSIEEQHVLRMQLNTTVDNLWQQLQYLFQNYHKDIDCKRRIYTEMKDNVNQNRMEIEDQDKSIEKIMAHINLKKHKLKNVQHSQPESLEQYGNMQREQLKSAFFIMKDIIQQAGNDAAIYLTILTMKSGDVIQRLETLLCKGKLLLKLSFLCEKIESKRENHPSYTFSASQCIQQQKGAASDDTASSLMGSFWNNLNEIYMDTCLLQKNEKHLCQENKKLHQLLKKYLDKFTVITD